MKMYDKRWLKLFTFAYVFYVSVVIGTDARRTNANLTACQHLRRTETRRSRALLPKSEHLKNSVRIPRCNRQGDFELIQCTNFKLGEDCWCVDEYGSEIPGTRNSTKSTVNCTEPEGCTASACRMFCPAGFERDSETGCKVCRCRDPCNGVECPNGQSCQVQEVKCKSEPCPPVPTCKKARSLSNFCPAGLPLSIEDTDRPFLCGLEPSKPSCPPLYQCMVESGNDYGVCCPAAIKFQKPGICPDVNKMEYSESTGYMCGTPCTHDLECRNMEKCCFTKGCHYNCQSPYNVTTCHQARALADVLAINEREGRGYVPECEGPGGIFSPKQCSRNGLVCWCVDPRTGHKIENSMNAASEVNCDGWENMVSRSLGRSFNMQECDTNICAAVCEYGFKNDHNGCPSCECSEPCEGYKCPLGSHCEVARDPLCVSGSQLCSSWPVCKPDLVYSNPCEFGTPLSDNTTGEIMYCVEERESREFKPRSFFEPESTLTLARSMNNHLNCPENYKCTKLHRQAESVCCPIQEQIKQGKAQQPRPQTMCEYLRDFSERMEGTEAGMQLAIPPPKCTESGDYQFAQCSQRKIRVSRAEQRKILEENTIRRMRMLLSTTNAVRSKRNIERLKLYRVADSALKINVASAIMTRSGKVIESGDTKQQSLGQLFETDFKKVPPAPKLHRDDNEVIEMEVEECWCVDSFGTEIPKSRGFNVTDDTCSKLREEIDCLDLTCRMGCEYGFTLDPKTRCPACQCRDPCDGVTCAAGEECRIVDVSCDEEYCPPVPACLSRKPGQCPFLVPPGPDNLDVNTCSYECRTDAHCDGAKRCCSNGCGTQCVQPQMKTACQHLQTIQMHQASELGIPAMKMHIAQCDLRTGKWNQVQCIPEGYCWCVDEQGHEISGTRVKGDSPVCETNSAYQCTEHKCSQECENGYKVDNNGCQTCECHNFCEEVNCANHEECQLISLECVDSPCPKMPICVPKRESICAEGSPYKQNDLEISCGPHNENEVCPTTHTCQLNPVNNRGVCCTKTRDVCFESMGNSCLAKSSSNHNVTRFRFSPKANKCLPIIIDLDEQNCHSKNLFHNEQACNSVCPVLTQCERLKLKNNLAARRSGHSSVWFQPRCDPVTGNWSPVQCLGKQPDTDEDPSVRKPPSNAPNGSNKNYGVCWCADKKGAPLKGTLTRDVEPICNSRQGRGRKRLNDDDPILEELIRQMTMLNDIDTLSNASVFDEFEMKLLPTSSTDNDLLNKNNMELNEGTTLQPTGLKDESPVTERILELANSLLDSKFSIESIKPMSIETTRCHALSKTAPFRISCNENGGFLPTQCNDKFCWCVDDAGNQLDSSDIFSRGSKHCEPTPINTVSVEIHLKNQSAHALRNVYDLIHSELQQLLGDAIENLRVQENFDGSVLVRFKLQNENKIDLAFAIESAIIAGEFQLASGNYIPDITRSHFVYEIQQPSLAQAVSLQENSIQLILFITATSTAFLVSVFVVYVMLKRNRHKVINTYGYPIYPPHKANTTSEKTVDFSAPIFVLSANTDDDSIKTTPNKTT